MLSIIILTFNSIKFIGPCLDSIFNQDCQDVEVIVVDNGSRDGTVDLVKKEYPQVILIENRQNLGACKARNQGIEVSCGEWVLTLDCDAILENNFLSKIINIIKDLPPRIGILQPKILTTDKKTIYSCGIYLSWLRRFFDIGKGKRDSIQFSEPKYIFGACSAAAFYKREMLEDIKEDTGYFDERFFFLVEDVDLAWRAQRKGWKALYSPQTVCCHTGNSSGISKEKRQYLCFRNRYLMIRKNEALFGKLKLFALSSCYESLRFLYLLFNNRYLAKSFLFPTNEKKISF